MQYRNRAGPEHRVMAVAVEEAYVFKNELKKETENQNDRILSHIMDGPQPTVTTET